MTTEGRDRRLFEELVAMELAYQVTYRISEKDTATGTAAERYEDLTSRLAELDAVEPGSFEGRGHTSTSAWLVRYGGTALELFDRLKSAVTARYDMLEVIQVVPGNHGRLPPPDKA